MPFFPLFPYYPHSSYQRPQTLRTCALWRPPLMAVASADLSTISRGFTEGRHTRGRKNIESNRIKEETSTTSKPQPMKEEGRRKKVQIRIKSPPRRNVGRWSV